MIQHTCFAVISHYVRLEYTRQERYAPLTSDTDSTNGRSETEPGKAPDVELQPPKNDSGSESDSSWSSHSGSDIATDSDSDTATDSDSENEDGDGPEANVTKDDNGELFYVLRCLVDKFLNQEVLDVRTFMQVLRDCDKAQIGPVPEKFTGLLSYVFFPE